MRGNLRQRSMLVAPFVERVCEVSQDKVSQSQLILILTGGEDVSVLLFADAQHVDSPLSSCECSVSVCGSVVVDVVVCKG